MATPLISVVDDDHSVRESLILDIRMPGMNGLELQRELSARDPDLPVIFITAHGSDQEVRARAFGAGAVDYLLKPLKEDEVLKAIDAALSAK